MESVPTRETFRKDNAYVEEEIDIRKIVTTLLRYKFPILAITVGLAIAAFAFSRLVLPKQYEASALVIMNKPIFTADLDSRIQTVPQMPDGRSLTDLAKTDDLMLEILQLPDAAGIPDGERTVEALKKRFDVALIGLNQLRLTVTMEDPQQAARLANLWAIKVAERINGLFDINNHSMTQVEQQLVTAYQKWGEAEENLLNYLPNSQVNTLDVNLANARNRYEAYLNKIHNIDLIASDLQYFDARLAAKNRNALLSLEDSLSLVTLQQRIMGGGIGIQVQAGGSELLGEGYMVADARAALSSLGHSLESQRKEFEAKLESESIQIASIATELERARYQLSELTVQRDLALNAFQALTSQQEENRISLAQNNQLARLAAPAIPPEEDSGPHSAINGVAAGILGFIVSVGSVLALDWWRSSNGAVQPLAVEQGKTARPVR
jgi:capsular polysaccharide biosynthesis protein